MLYTTPFLPIGMPRTLFVSILIPILVTLRQRVIAYAVGKQGHH